jgi:hypothetical protein
LAGVGRAAPFTPARAPPAASRTEVTRRPGRIATPLDRYTRGVLTVIALALSVLALTPWVRPIWVIGALGPGPAEAQRRKEIAVPAAWGKPVGYSDGYGLFEAPDGTLRQVGLETGRIAAVTKRN